MSDFQRQQPAMAAKIADLIESGLSAEEVIQFFRDRDEKAKHSHEEEPETFPNEIIIISQALAYRSIAVEDIDEVYNLLSSNYSEELKGEEAFRSGEAISKSQIVELVSSPDHKWIVVEAPSGRDVEKDGLILGCACFSTDGLFRRGGSVEGRVGSVRFLAVLKRYRGFCVGRRLLERVEDAIFKDGCVAAMCCIASTRESMMNWTERRGYKEHGASEYPAANLGHTLRPECGDIGLIRFLKLKAEYETERGGNKSDNKPSGQWHLKNKPSLAAAAAAVAVLSPAAGSESMSGQDKVKSEVALKATEENAHEYDSVD